MILFTPEQFADKIKNGVAQWIMNRGYYVMYDSGRFTELIRQYVSNGHSAPEISETEYVNIVNDFYFHNIWACEKLKRGGTLGGKNVYGCIFEELSAENDRIILFLSEGCRCMA